MMAQAPAGSLLVLRLLERPLLLVGRRLNRDKEQEERRRGSVDHCGVAHRRGKLSLAAQFVSARKLVR